MTSMLATIFNLFYNWTCPNNKTLIVDAGHSASCPMSIQAVPGLMTLLDVALYRTVEGQLTGIVCTGHALLAAWLDLKSQAAIVLMAAKYELSDMGVIISSSSTSSSSSSASSSASSLLRPALIEGFARACFDAACDAIERITTDRLAISANLSDPYESGSSSSSSSSAGGPSATPTLGSISGAGGAGGPPTSVGGVGGGGSSSSSSGPDLLAALQDSSLDTGRRDPTLQRPRDCWETSRLLCPDHVWADDVCSFCQRLLRQLSKHAFVTEQNNHHHHIGILESPALLGDVIMTRQYPGGAAIRASGYTERHAALLLQLLQTDINCRLLQFRSAVEAESVVSKRLYLVKCEYRAPFRAFLEAHQSVQRAPSLALVQEYTTNNNSSGSSNSNTAAYNKIVEERRVVAKTRLQKLLETPELVETLALERQIELFEVEMAKALYPFCELARYLDYKRASLKPFAVPSGILSNKDDANNYNNNINNSTSGDLMVELQETLYRLKSCLQSRKTASSQHDASGGIRPLLLDLQGVPRDEEKELIEHHHHQVATVVAHNNNAMLFKNNPKYREAVYCKRLERLIRHLRILAKLTERRNFFRCTDNNNNKLSSSSASSAVIDIPSSIVRGCMTLDHELLRCQAQDWYTMTVRQVELATDKNLELLAEQIRTAEVQKSLALATSASLQVVRQRLEVIHGDCEKRFEVLKETIEEVCWREMNLFVQLSAPEPHQVLVLPENTSAIGVFGQPLQMAGERLPIG